MRSRGWLFALLGGALLAALGLLLAANLEWGERKVWVGWQGEARTNPYLAAKRFLDRSGWATECFQGLPMPRIAEQETGILILPSRSLRLSPGQSAALVSFVERGGLLLAEGAWTEAAGTEETQDLLFAAFGARIVASQWWEKLRDQSPEASRAFQKAHQTLRVKLAGDLAADFQVRFAPTAVLEDRAGAAESASGDDAGLKVLVYRKGKGRAVLFTDMQWLQNATIGNHDHAAFLEALTGLATTERGRASIVIREQAPRLSAWLREHAPAALGTFAVLVALALWSTMPRFGPALPDPPEARRSLLEHLAACGRFQWRLRDGQALLQAARQAALDRVGQVHPAWAALGPDDFCRTLAHHFDLPEDRVFRALRYERHPDTHGFTEALQTLDHIRKAL